MIKKLFTALYAVENILHFNEDYGNAVFNSNEFGIVNIDLNKISLDDNFVEDDPDTIVFVRLLIWHIKFGKSKALKKDLNKSLVPAAWHPNRWWDWCVSEDEENGNRSNVYWGIMKVCVCTRQNWGIRTFLHSI